MTRFQPTILTHGQKQTLVEFADLGDEGLKLFLLVIFSYVGENIGAIGHARLAALMNSKDGCTRSSKRRAKKLRDMRIIRCVSTLNEDGSPGENRYEIDFDVLKRHQVDSPDKAAQRLLNAATIRFDAIDPAPHENAAGHNIAPHAEVHPQQLVDQPNAGGDIKSPPPQPENGHHTHEPPWCHRVTTPGDSVTVGSDTVTAPHMGLKDGMGCQSHDSHPQNVAKQPVSFPYTGLKDKQPGAERKATNAPAWNIADLFVKKCGCTAEQGALLQRVITGDTSIPCDSILLACGFDPQEASRRAMMLKRGRIVQVIRAMRRKLQQGEGVNDLARLVNAYFNRSKPDDYTRDGLRLWDLERKRHQQRFMRGRST